MSKISVNIIIRFNGLTELSEEVSVTQLSLYCSWPQSDRNIYWIPPEIAGVASPITYCAHYKLIIWKAHKHIYMRDNLYAAVRAVGYSRASSPVYMNSERIDLSSIENIHTGISFMQMQTHKYRGGRGMYVSTCPREFTLNWETTSNFIIIRYMIYIYEVVIRFYLRGETTARQGNS